MEVLRGQNPVMHMQIETINNMEIYFRMHDKTHMHTHTNTHIHTHTHTHTHTQWVFFRTFNQNTCHHEIIDIFFSAFLLKRQPNKLSTGTLLWPNCCVHTHSHTHTHTHTSTHIQQTTETQEAAHVMVHPWSYPSLPREATQGREKAKQRKIYR